MPTPHKKICIKCSVVHTIFVEDKDFIAWKSGKLIQDVMPYLSADEREILISGICGKCYDKLYEQDT
jgi:ribosomal protein L40E